MRYVIVSNRTPSGGPPVGGLQVALMNVIRDRGGLWFGWSGKITEERSRRPRHPQVRPRQHRHRRPAAQGRTRATTPAMPTDACGRCSTTGVHLAAFDPASYRRLPRGQRPFRPAAAAADRAGRPDLGARLPPDPAGAGAAAAGRDEPDRLLPAHPLPPAPCCSSPAAPAPSAGPRRCSTTTWSASRPSDDLRAFHDYVTPRAGGPSTDDRSPAPSAARCAPGPSRSASTPRTVRGAGASARGAPARAPAASSSSLRRAQPDHRRRPARLFQGPAGTLRRLRAAARRQPRHARPGHVLLQIAPPSRERRRRLSARSAPSSTQATGHINGGSPSSTGCRSAMSTAAIARDELAGFYRARRHRPGHAAARRHEPGRQGIRRRAGPATIPAC